MSSACVQPDCTVGDTGSCVLGDDPKTCAKRLEALTLQAPDVEAETAPITAPPQDARFPLSLSLTPDDARQLMAERYCHLVGILGVPDSGKTAALVSLFLLLSRAKLEGLRFSDSRSLMAFNEISQGARHWNEDGALPDQLTVHTELADDRSAGFLHLQVRPTAGGEPLDLLLPDLPGEWSTALMDESRTERLSFFSRADAVWLMVDGRQLADAATRRWTIHRTQLLIQRLAGLVPPADTPVSLVVTHRDEGEPHAASLAAIADEAARLGFAMEVRAIASFAIPGSIAPGHGIADLIKAVEDVTEPPVFWPGIAEGARAMLRYNAPETEA